MSNDQEQVTELARRIAEYPQGWKVAQFMDGRVAIFSNSSWDVLEMARKLSYVFLEYGEAMNRVGQIMGEDLPRKDHFTKEQLEKLVECFAIIRKCERAVIAIQKKICPPFD